MAADDLVMQGAMASWAMVLTLFSQNISISALEGLSEFTHSHTLIILLFCLNKLLTKYIHLLDDWHIGPILALWWLRNEWEWLRPSNIH